MSETVPNRLAGIPVRPLKAELKRGEGVFRKLNPDAGAVLEHARVIVHLEAKQMADTMDLSHSLVLRGLKSTDDLGFHRLWNLSDAFWWHLVVAIIRTRKLADVSTTITKREVA